MNLLHSIPSAVRCFALGLVLLNVMNVANGASIFLDQSRVIDAGNSFPEPPAPGTLGVAIIDGPNGPTVVEVAEGGVIGGLVAVLGSSHLKMLGGEIQGGTTVRDQATLTLIGGLIDGKTRFYQAADFNGVIDIHDSATLNLRGGKYFGVISQAGSSTINIYGSNLQVIGELPVSTEDLSFVQVTGTYLDGSQLDVSIIRSSPAAKVLLFNVPEPPAFTLLTATVCMFFLPAIRSPNSPTLKQHSMN